MPSPDDYELSFRPRSYWGPQTLATHFGSKIKGELRRLDAVSGVEIDANPNILGEALSEDERAAVGAIHPWFMGGEYLPDLLRNEVEIARVIYKSTTMDVTSIRARQMRNRITYRIVDEYEFTSYDLNTKSSNKPLTLKQVIDLIEFATEGGLVGEPRELNYLEGGMDAEDIYDFASVSSQFYAELSNWYDESNSEWLESKLRERAITEAEDEAESNRMSDFSASQIGEEGWKARGFLSQADERRFLKCVYAASWVGKMSGKWDRRVNHKIYEKITVFVRDYVEEFGKLPQGSHEVVNKTVTFSEIGDS
jgi:hypothetical protein